SLAASALTAAVEFVRWNGVRLPAVVRSGRSSFENPTRPSLPPSNVAENTREGDHSAGVFPFASTILAETEGNGASGISVFLRYARPRSKLWLPRPSAEKPILFISAIVGVSPKKLEIGGVAPTESPPAMVMEPFGASAREGSDHRLREAAPPAAELRPPL